MVDELLAFRILFSGYAVFEPLSVRLEMNEEIETSVVLANFP